MEIFNAPVIKEGIQLFRNGVWEQNLWEKTSLAT